jgi:hypothetical protein
VEIIKNKEGWYHDNDENEDNDNKMTTMTTTNRMIAVQMEGVSNCTILSGKGVMIQPVTGSVTASEPHDIVAAQSNTPPKQDSKHELIRC